jgi:hypothetical protein
MPKLFRDNATAHHDHGPVEEWGEDVDGYTVNIVSFKADLDATPLLKGLPGDRCTCPHWGYVFKGRVTYTFDDHEEIHEAGDAFYVPGGHLQRADAGTELLQFSPSDELHVVEEALMRNMMQMQQA